ncbi:MAG: FecR family protein [Janthinobacterium lividum]
MISQVEFDALLQRYLAGHSLPGERQQVEQWSEQLGHEEDLLLHPSLQAEVKTAMWRRIGELTAEAKALPVVVPFQPQRPTFWREPALRWAAAAVLTLGVGAAWWLPQRHSAAVAAAAPHWLLRTNTTPRQQYLLLADGSRVTLATGSTLKYLANLAGARREVYLTGQACFKVAKNPARPFLVYTDKLVTTVLGTTFLVQAYAGQPALVAVREGRVAVQRRQGAELGATPAQPAAAGVLLLPNQQVTYSTATHRLAKELVEKPVILTPQPLAFKNRPVAEVLAALEKAYGVNIVYDPAKLNTCTITISFEDESLFEQLNTLCKVLDTSYKMANNAQIIFESAGCKAS